MPEVLVNPKPSGQIEKLTLADRPSSLRGKVVGLLSNGKPNGDAFLEAVGTLLIEEQAPARVERYRKSTWSRRAPEELLVEMDRCDVVITAVGD